MESQVVITPYSVTNTSGKEIDYQKIITNFGCSPIDPPLIEKIQKLTGRKPHHFLTRGIFFCHRDLQIILENYQKGIPFFLYTGRGPSSDAIHLGHLIPFIFTKYLQEAFKVPLVIQITDDQKYFHKGEGGQSLQHFYNLAIQNIKDILAIGFDPDLTFIFINSQYIGHMYQNVCLFQKNINLTTIKAIFGVQSSSNSGIIAYPALQAAPAISTSFPHIFGKRLINCLIPQGIDQDPYFRMTRDICAKFNLPKPACIHSKFIPTLQGHGSKMNSSTPQTSIFVTDELKTIKRKIAQSFSGGKASKQEHQRLGADLSQDICWAYLNYFLQDDKELQQIGNRYSSGKMMSSQIKERLSNLLNQICQQHRAKRVLITKQTIDKFLSIRPFNIFKETQLKKPVKATKQDLIYQELIKISENPSVDSALGCLLGAFVVDSMLKCKAKDQDQISGELSGVGETLVANVIGISKCKKKEDVEKIANQYFYLAKGKLPQLSQVQNSSFQIKEKVTKGFNFAPAFNKNAQAQSSYDLNPTLARVIPSTLFLGEEEGLGMIQIQSKLSHSNQSNLKQFMLSYQLLRSNKMQAQVQKVNKEGAFYELYCYSKQVQSLKQFSDISLMKATHKTKVLLAALLGKRIGLRAINSKSVLALFNYKGKEERKFNFKQIAGTIKTLIEKIVK